MSRANGVVNALKRGTTRFEFPLSKLAKWETYLFKIYASLAVPFEAAPCLTNENFPNFCFVSPSTLVSLDFQFEKLLRERNEVSGKVLQRRVGDVVCEQREKESTTWGRGRLLGRSV
jgi:hypothetical protein